MSEQNVSSLHACVVVRGLSFTKHVLCFAVRVLCDCDRARAAVSMFECSVVVIDGAQLWQC